MSSSELKKDTGLNPNVEPAAENTNPVVEVNNTANTENQETEPVVSADNKVETVDYTQMSKEELITVLKSLLEQDINLIREDVERIKQAFYKKVKAGHEIEKQKWVDAGENENSFVPAKDELEDSLKTLLNDYKTEKAALHARLEKEKENNLLQKQHVLEQMKLLVDSNDDVSTHIGEFKNLQARWKTTGPVPAQNSTELWKEYNTLQETFWDLIKINNELREYDFKKNLEAKTALCEAAESLADEEDVISAFQRLQKLHEEWHELGPVARDLREEIWSRFKEASTIINRKHQAHFDEIRKLEDENYVAKTALCEKIEAFDYSGLNTYKLWDEATATILAWQDEWRAIGFAPRKVNQKLFERYRSACDAFFAAKTAFYKESKAVQNQNLEKKRVLCEQAESLKDSTDWKSTSDKLIQLQKDWKTVGPVSKKYSDDLWNRFISACDYFFEQKNKNVSDQKSVETENLKLKKALIEKVKAIETKENPKDALIEVRELIAEWNNIGHVPFKEKDKIYKEYRSVVDAVFDALNIDASQRRLDTFKSNLKDMSSKGENKLFRERERLVRAYEHLKSEIATYENNIGFFTSSSKKGGGLIKEMERKIDALKEECKLIEQKIALIEENLE
ncbi:MAG: DUF349 domain-containing protein [Paludibacter sp.]|nr:DUF349 domain-containing protein [Paludibacter sp.]